MDQIITTGSGAASETQAGAQQGSAHAGEGLEVTASAVKRIRAILAKESIPVAEGGLRLGVKGGGCSGMSYSVGFDTKPRERDNIFEFEDVRVFVDPKSFVYLKGPNATQW